MPAHNRQHKPLFKLVVMPESIFMQAPRPKRSTAIIIALLVMLAIVFWIGLNDPELRSKVLELVISIIEAILTLFSVDSK